MGLESEPGGHTEAAERVELPYADDAIEQMMDDKEAGAALFEADPVTWLRGALTVGKERGASEVSDEELLRKYVYGGRFEWDPYVAHAVAQYLRDHGYSGHPGLRVPQPEETGLAKAAAISVNVASELARISLRSYKRD